MVNNSMINHLVMMTIIYDYWEFYDETKVRSRWKTTNLLNSYHLGHVKDDIYITLVVLRDFFGQH